MDPVTHCLVGGMVAKSVKAPRRRFWIMMFLGEAPDLDVFFGGFGPWAFWLQHRGITHSFFGAAIQAVLYAWMFSRFDTGPWRQRLLQYSIPLFLHAGCDYLTSYGVPLLSPFTFHEFSLDLVPAVTVVPLSFMLVGLIYLSRKKYDGWQATRPLWVGWGLYLLFSFSCKAYAYRLIETIKQPEAVVSGLGNPFHWTAVVAEDSPYSYQPYLIDILTRNITKRPAVITPDDNKN